MIDEGAIAERYRLLSAQGVLDERGRRLWAAAEARSAGRGGIAAVVRATGISESTVTRGLADLDSGERPRPGRMRRHPGRVPILEREPGLAEDLERLVDPVTRGDPESPLRWTSKSAAKLAQALREMGHRVVDRTVLRLLAAQGYSLQANKKTREGAQHPDRDAQFALGHAIPYGVYDLGADEGWVSVGITRDTAQFAVNSILAWWEHLGQQRYPDARTLTITADSGGSNSPRTRLWRVEFGRLADKTGLNIRVLHFPPGTSKWNKIEHRMFSFVSLNWRGKPLESLAVIVNLIAGTTTSTGLRIYARRDERVYEKGVEVTDHQLAAVNIIRDALHGDWNYAVTPSVAPS